MNEAIFYVNLPYNTAHRKDGAVEYLEELARLHNTVYHKERNIIYLPLTGVMQLKLSGMVGPYDMSNLDILPVTTFHIPPFIAKEPEDEAV